MYQLWYVILTYDIYTTNRYYRRMIRATVIFRKTRILEGFQGPETADNSGLSGAFQLITSYSGYLLASMAEWLRAWDTLATVKLWRREVVSSIPDRGTIVG